MIILVVVAAVLLVLGALALWWLLGGGHRDIEVTPVTMAEPEPLELPPIDVENMTSKARRFGQQFSMFTPTKGFM